MRIIRAFWNMHAVEKISGAVIIGAGSAGGVVVLLILVSATFVLVCYWLQKCKNRQAYLMPNPVQTDTKSSEDDITTINAAYKPSQPPLELDVVYDTANENDYQVPNKLSTPLKRSDSGPMSVERNVAYATTNHDPALSLSTNTNVAYFPFNVQQTTDSEEQSSDSYDYI